eukprot:TRINITY_DN12378_c0_g1_i2.p1 TRINITY_DN12378_c0_g1~~TRINITY_DN12378_c0_g1_i2.p1  ORF type:complete len:255 (+),score=62.69 TRINITY_DN12378_c0_g1_i2:415-1179(+)
MGLPDVEQKFRMPTSENLVPIRIDIEVDGRRLKDAFSWHADEPDSTIQPFAKRLVKEAGLPSVFTHPVAQSIQAQLAEFRSYEAQPAPAAGVEKIRQIKLEVRVNNTYIEDQFLWDLNNYDSDPEAFAESLARDLEIDDPEVAPAIALAIREQLYEMLKQSLMGREGRISKRARREKGVPDYSQVGDTTALSLMKRPNNKISVVRKRNDWEEWEPMYEILTDKEVEALDAKDERDARFKRRQEDELGPRSYYRP